MSFSITSSSTMTLAGWLRLTGGGTFGGSVSTAWIGSPWGGPKSPFAEPPVWTGTGGGALAPVAAFDGLESQPAMPAAAAMAKARSRRFMDSLRPVDDVQKRCAKSFASSTHQTLTQVNRDCVFAAGSC